MSELQTESEAMDVLLGAVMAPDSQDLEAKQPQNDEAVDIEEPGEVEEERAEPEAKAKEEEAAPEEDEIEIPSEDGKEPTRVKVADLVQKAQEFDRIESQKAQILDQVERQAVEIATGQLRQVEQHSRQVGTMLQAALQMLQPPQPPNADAMLNPASPQYDPDGYHRQYAAYQSAQQSFGRAQQYSQQLLERAQQADAQAKEIRETRELQRLQREWPQFGEPEVTNKFVSDMTKAYGFTAQELDDVLVDHRQALVARDALAFRAMKAQSGDVRAKVEAKAPKLVRSKQEAKGSSAQARDTKGQYASEAKARLAKSNSDDDAAAFFTGLVKAGRI